VVYGYDPAGRLQSVTDWNARVTRYGYDANGRLSRTEWANGARQTRVYDAVP
jgi:YD repeat-containing protein